MPRPAATPTPQPRPARPAEPRRTTPAAPESWANPLPDVAPRPLAPTPAASFLDVDRLARLESLDVADLDRDFAAAEAAGSIATRPEPVAPEVPAVEDGAEVAIRRRLPRRLCFRRSAGESAGAFATDAAVLLVDAEPEVARAIEPVEAEIPAAAPSTLEAGPTAEEPFESPPSIAPTFQPEPEPTWTYSPVVESMATTGHARRFVADTSGVGYGYVSSEARPVVEPEPRPRRAVEIEEDEAETFDPTRSRRSRADEAWVLPSVQDVLNAGLRARDAAAAIPRPAARAARASIAAPTVAREPAHWTPPAWLATPPAMALTLAVGGVLAFCSWRQATVSHEASTAIETSAAVRRGLAKDRPLAKSIVPPSPSWWGAAPAHLAQWGVYLDGTRVEHGWDATPAGMLEAAAAVGPLDSLARFALARKAGDPTPGGPTAAGLSRDAVSLAWTGRTLHRSGKNAQAMRAYRRALEIAAKADPTPSGALTFSDDPNVPRYLLPGEGLAAAVVRELAADASWAYQDWAEAVPESGVSALAAARVLRKQGRPEADAILKRILERSEADARARAGGPDEPADDPDGEALALAVAAEALALQADWKDAERRYRAAIDRMPDPRIRRSWWFNIADVALHLNDDDHRRAALDEALAVADSDDVSRRAMDLQRGPTIPGTNRLKAN
ncbi:hypothetical protein [Paludisphaera mucosa]|uniref:Tetratricopeptide repeat protein n=1 Tax=Paludisphaera mucosa TaxID=3030827 RepID=A0ABT6FJ30_9BACT|nr:hypothetical protein [Paludisphaera mucosa]MDG3007590.1 hypothetical protein [Paludisphaera mucosa]